MKKNVLFFSFFILFPFSSLSAQTTTDPGTEIALIMTISFLVFVVATLMYIIGVMGTNIDPIVDFFIRVKNYVVPQSTEEAADMGHDFDGIRELDNRIPPWFNYLFLLTVIIAALYLLDYHVLKISKLSSDEYREEIAAADIQRKILLASGGSIDENNLVALKDASSLKSGAENFQKYCISCHGPQGGGIVGPNLTDEYWLHGGGIKNVYSTIKNGWPAKGMISWQLVFTPQQIQQIASYVLSLQGINPPGGKAPQGDKWVEPVAVDSTKVNVKI